MIDTTKWQTEDPRHILADYRDSWIIIIRPIAHGWNVGMAFVAVQHEWYIHTNFSDHTSIDTWDPDWKWILAPKK
jgi:hypothetical protein